jgi:hypothetical protein
VETWTKKLWKWQSKKCVVKFFHDDRTALESWSTLPRLRMAITLLERFMMKLVHDDRRV